MTDVTLKALLSSPLALFALMMVASLSNGLKQLVVIRQTGTPMSWGKYLSYIPETFGMILANVIGYVVLVLTDQLNFASALAVGYGTNSLVDLLPGKRAAVLKSTPDDPEKIETRTQSDATKPDTKEKLP
jgi:hypothetical protein